MCSVGCRGVVRAPCPRCRCSRKFYCYTCYEVVGMDPKLVPKVQLPVKVDMYVYCVRGRGQLAVIISSTHNTHTESSTPMNFLARVQPHMLGY